jgi:hypothetical protein
MLITQKKSTRVDNFDMVYPQINMLMITFTLHISIF